MPNGLSYILLSRAWLLNYIATWDLKFMIYIYITIYKYMRIVTEFAGFKF